MIFSVLAFAFILNLQGALLAKDFRTNSLEVKNPPVWVSQSDVQKLTDKLQLKLEWKIRRIPLIWHQSGESFQKTHSLGPEAAAVTISSQKGVQVHIGPKVNAKDYLEILGHELVHVIFKQKYKGAIPKWLEEGFANFFSRDTKVDYEWLKKQKLPKDVTTLEHPYKNASIDLRVHYKVSQALVEMLDKKCDLNKILRLSVRKSLETYIRNTCNITDINASFQAWILK